MCSRLPSVLSFYDLPLAELCAARLDGEVYAVDECFSPLDEIEQCTQRARALSPIFPPKLIAEQHTAAWVLGALQKPPIVHQACAGADARVRPALHRRIIVRQVIIDDSETLTYSGLRVTTPLRTVTDLARFSPNFGVAEATIVIDLLALGHLGFDDCRRAINARRNLPRKGIALRRIRSCLIG